MTRLLLVAFFVEVGTVLMVVPWSVYWDRNYFVQLLPQLEVLFTNNFLRGAISGLGLINLAAGVSELVALFTSRPAPEAPLQLSSRPTEE